MVVLGCSIRAGAQAYTFTQYSGTALRGNGSSSPALITGHLVFDNQGSIYLDDLNNHVIRRVSPGGEMSLFAGSTSGTVDGFGAAVKFAYASLVGFDPVGNLLVFDGQAGTLRQIAPNGLVTTRLQVRSGSSYDALAHARMDAAGNVYVANYYGPQVYKVTPNGAILTLVQPGQSLNAAVNGLAVDPNGVVYLAAGDHTIRRLSGTGVLELWAGASGVKGSTDGSRLDARFNLPLSIEADAHGNVYVGDVENRTIRRISPSGVVSTVAGTAGLAGVIDGAGAAARLGAPGALSLHPSGEIYFFDRANGSIRSVSATGVVRTIARDLNAADGPLATASFNYALHLATDGLGNLLVAQIDGVRRVSPAGVVTTLTANPAGEGQLLFTAEDPRTMHLSGITADGSGGAYVTSVTQHTVMQVSADREVTIVAGIPDRSGTTNGPGNVALFHQPGGIVRDSKGNLFVADTGNAAIRKIAPDRAVTLFAGLMGVKGQVDGVGTAALFTSPRALTIDGQDNLYVTDAGSMVRKITPGGEVSTLATGFNFQWSSGDIAADAQGNVFVADNGTYTIQKITPAGVVSTIGGLRGVWGTLDGTGSRARFAGPSGIAVDAQGTLYVSQNTSADFTLRRGVPITVPPTFVRSPESMTVLAGSSLVLSASAPHAETFQWFRNGVPISDASDSTPSIATASPAVTGTFTVVATNAAGSNTSPPFVITPVASSQPGRFVNLSVLAPASAAEIVTLGFVNGGVGSAGPQPLLIRGLGPTIVPFGVVDASADPVLTLFRQSTGAVLQTNDDWGGAQAVVAANAAFTGLPLPDAASKDAAFVSSLTSGGYTVQVTGKSAGLGRVLAEVYDATTAPDLSRPRLLNVSTRAAIALHGRLTIGFFIDGETARTVLLRVSGPALKSFGVADVMPDPQLTLYRGQSVLLHNDGWRGNARVKAAAAAVYAFPIADETSHDAAVLVTLPPGGYTVEAGSVSGSPGSVIIEAYEVP